MVLSSVCPCTTDPMLMLLSGAAVCTSGMISDVTAKITLYANMQVCDVSLYLLEKILSVLVFCIFFCM